MALCCPQNKTRYLQSPPGKPACDLYFSIYFPQERLSAIANILFICLRKNFLTNKISFLSNIQTQIDTHIRINFYPACSLSLHNANAD